LNSTAFSSLLDQTPSGSPTWRNGRYLVWGLGNSQWNAFLAFPRYVHRKLMSVVLDRGLIGSGHRTAP
jgi:hypothetical protein